SGESTRYAMGDTLRLAERIGLIDMAPRGDLTSTGYALAQPGREYVVLAPNGGAFEVTLEAGTYAVEWFSVVGREGRDAESLTVEAVDSAQFVAPFGESEAAVLYIRRLD